MTINKGAIDYNEFKILVQAIRTIDPEKYFQQVLSLINRVNVFEEMVKAENASKVKEDVEGDPTLDTEGYGSFLDELPKVPLKLKKLNTDEFESRERFLKEYKTQEGPGWPPQDS
jgi:hypothetical protein